MVNSRLGLFSAAPSGFTRVVLHPTGAPLLPKLRGQLAEFLNEESPARLGALAPAHQCRSAVRALVASRTRLFSAPGADRVVLGHPRTSPHLGSQMAYHLPPAWLDAATPAQRAALPRASGVRTSSSTSGNGIETVCPSPTLFSLGLGPTHPPWMNLPEEPLGIRRGGFFTSLTLLMPAFALVVAPATLPGDLPRSHDAPLPRLASINTGQASAASVLDLSPAKLSARPHSTSELLRTLSRMAASKPTSWLSGRRHLL